MSVYGYYRTVTVRITATPGTASTQDYVFPDTELTFDGTTTTQTVTGYIVGDTDVEGDETFTLTGTLVGDAGIPYMGSTAQQPYQRHAPDGRTIATTISGCSGASSESTSISSASVRAWNGRRSQT